jgi:hypothetical protein
MVAKKVFVTGVGGFVGANLAVACFRMAARCTFFSGGALHSGE